MWLLPVAFPVGMAVGLLARGSLSNAYRAPLRWGPLLLIAMALGLVVAFSTDPPGGDLLLLLDLVLFLAVALRNLHMAGAGVIAVGIALNLAPVITNGHMPVRAETIVQAELAGPDDYEEVQLGTGRRLDDGDDGLTQLGPIIPVPLLKEMFSFGDLVVMAGLVNLGFRAVKPRVVRAAPKHASTRHADEADDQMAPVDAPGEPVLVGD